MLPAANGGARPEGRAALILGTFVKALPYRGNLFVHLNFEQCEAVPAWLERPLLENIDNFRVQIATKIRVVLLVSS
jgi:hypothetical protein